MDFWGECMRGVWKEKTVINTMKTSSWVISSLCVWECVYLSFMLIVSLRTGRRNYLIVDKNAYVRARCILGLQVMLPFFFWAGVRQAGGSETVCCSDEGIQLSIKKILENLPWEILVKIENSGLSGCLPCHCDGRQNLQEHSWIPFWFSTRPFPEPPWSLWPAHSYSQECVTTADLLQNRLLHG